MDPPHRCSRYINGHARSHWEKTKAVAQLAKKESLEVSADDSVGHCIAISLADLSVWCYECSAYLKHPSLDSILRHLEDVKFGPSDKESQKHSTQVGLQNNENRTDEDAMNKNGFGEDESIAEADSDSESSNEILSKTACPIISPKNVPSVLFLPSSVEEMAKYILSPQCKSIAILAGAGMSVSSGIPDFRSPGGMYETLRPDLLTATEEERMAMEMDPTTVFEKGMFLQNSLPCLELKRAFILGTRHNTWKATLTHRFVELLHQKTGKLTRLYTQNIDGLEGQCRKLPREKVIPVHGSMDEAACEICGSETDFNEFCDNVKHSIKDITGQDPDAPTESRTIPCKTCGQPAVKPTIVLFRSNLPQEFFISSREDLPTVDLLIVVGTSLTVAPANSLVYRVPPTALRMVINNEPVGERLGIQYGSEANRDFFARGNCDEVILDLLCHLDWMDDAAKLLSHLPQESARLLRDRIACMGLDEN